jgi:Flp pilus assembly protein TadB
MAMGNEEQPRDHAAGGSDADPLDETSENRQLEDNLKSRATWLRLVFMIVFVFLYGLSRLVVGAVVILQFFWVLITGETNVRLKSFGQALATYTYQIVVYLTWNSDERPFPFDQDWPA